MKKLSSGFQIVNLYKPYSDFIELEIQYKGMQLAAVSREKEAESLMVEILGGDNDSTANPKFPLRDFEEAIRVARETFIEYYK